MVPGWRGGRRRDEASSAALLSLALLGSSCASEEQLVRSYADEGEIEPVAQHCDPAVAVGDGGLGTVTVRVVFDGCASYCAEIERAECSVQRVGAETLVVTSAARTVEVVEPDEDCPDACRVVEARCEVGDLAPGTYTLAHGEERQALEVSPCGNRG